jgi:hypothetical protein
MDEKNEKKSSAIGYGYIISVCFWKHLLGWDSQIA